MEYFVIALFFFLDLLVLLSPLFLGVTRGTKIGVKSTVLWIPILMSHLVLVYFAIGCGHGSGKGGVCDFMGLLMFAPQIIVLAIFAVVYRKTGIQNSFED